MSESQEQVSPNGFKEQSRDGNGLLTSVQYVFNQDGTIAWRRMIKPEYLVPNDRVTQEKDVTKLQDNELLILLGGLKELAQVRGYHSVEYRPTAAKLDYFSTVCRIVWIPNYETQGQSKVFEAIAGASLNNTEGFAQYYLAEIAENRAFARCIRNFLKINIVSKEEASKKLSEALSQAQESVQDGSDPVGTLEELVNRAGLTFEKIQQRLLKDGVKDAVNFQTLQDIPKPSVFELIDKITTHLEKKPKKTSRTAAESLAKA
jgi:hypothetical protein